MPELSPTDRTALVEYRLAKARLTLKEAEDNLKLGNWNLAVNRLYYSVFYAVLALNLKNGEITKTHSGAFTVFSKRYILSGIIDREEANLYRMLMTMRQTGDYDDFFDWERDDVEPLFPKVENFLKKLIRMVGED